MGKQKKKLIPPPWKLYHIFFNPAYSWDAKYVIKPVSAYFSWFFLHTSITADMVTMIMTLLFAFSGYFFAIGTPIYLFIGIACLFVGWILDGSDGEIALYHKTFSLRGKYLDYVSHGIFPGLFFCLGLGVFSQVSQISFLFFGCSAAFFHLMHNYTRFTFIVILKNADIKLENILKKDGSIKKLLRYLSFGNFDFPWTVLMLLAILFYQVPFFVIFSGIVIPLRWLIHMYLCSEYGSDGAKKVGQSYS